MCMNYREKKKYSNIQIYREKNHTSLHSYTNDVSECLIEMKTSNRAS